MQTARAAVSLAVVLIGVSIGGIRAGCLAPAYTQPSAAEALALAPSRGATTEDSLDYGGLFTDLADPEISSSTTRMRTTSTTTMRPVATKPPPPPLTVERGPTASLMPGDKCPCDEAPECFCTLYYDCAFWTEQSTNESNLLPAIDIRQDKQACTEYSYACCKPREQRPQRIPHPTPPPIQTHNDDGSLQCGIRNERGFGVRITGDEHGEAQFGEFPWHVAILEDTPMGKLYVCGGSLISSNAIITGAHCVKGVSHPSKYRIRAGEWDTQHSDEIYTHQDRIVSKIVTHPDYYGGNLQNDIAVVFVQEPFTLGGHISTICLPEQDEAFDYGKCVVTGWGRDSFGRDGLYQVILKKIELPLVPFSRCQDQLRRTRLGPRFNLHYSFMCAGGEPKVDACEGDGGGPLACPTPDDPERYTLAGIVSWGVGCGTADVPGVYGKVSLFRKWIDQQLSAEARHRRNL